MLAGRDPRLTVLLKLQLGVVFKVKELLPAAVGVPVAVSTMFCAPVPANVPLAAKVTPLAVVEILNVPTVVTVAVIVCVTPCPVVEVPVVITPVEEVEQVYAETMAVPLDEGEMPKHFQFTALVVPVFVCIQFKSVLKMVNPDAGLAIASRCAVVIRGKNTPWLVLTKSSAALALGVVVPIPTCALLASEQNITKMSVVILFLKFILCSLFLYFYLFHFTSLYFTLLYFPSINSG
jgi:hypothetical protein